MTGRSSAAVSIVPGDGTIIAGNCIAIALVETVGEEAAYLPYLPALPLYQTMGFLHIDTIDPYAGWDPGNRCALYVKILQAYQDDP